ncbi:MAG: 30S ribosomal protein S2 [Candidatus Brocadiae bacterium]|nr:30S ribosomal protein S2 [Candidatus Brocadiia bacterium]
MATLNIRDLIKAGFHFGHRSSRWNPAMKPYIFKQRNQIHIIDLMETLRGLIAAGKLTEAIGAKGESILFVGTKKQAAGLVEREARRCNSPYVAERWPGGLLTNYTTVRKRLDRLVELEEMEETGQIDLYSKKMISSLRREKRKILRNLGGVRKMDRMPGLLVVVDPAQERIAVKEAVKLEIPIVALTDTDGEPAEIDVVVPGNDDSIAAIEIYLSVMADGVLRGTGDEPAGPSGEAVPEAESTELEEGAAEADAPAPSESEQADSGADDSEKTGEGTAAAEVEPEDSGSGPEEGEEPP